jgi:hypothetical protein
MAELADAADSKSADLRVLGVQLPLPAPRLVPVASNRLRGLAPRFLRRTGRGNFMGAPKIMPTGGSDDAVNTRWELVMSVETCQEILSLIPFRNAGVE